MARKGHHEVRKSHDHHSEPPADISGNNAQKGTDEDGCAVGRDAYNQGGAGPVNQTGKESPTQKIGAEPEFPIGRQRRPLRGQALKVLFVRRVRRKDRREYGRRRKDQDQTQPEHGKLIV